MNINIIIINQHSYVAIDIEFIFVYTVVTVIVSYGWTTIDRNHRS